ncbi:MAG: hypothetical protein DRJ61_12590 [Acidobacteria bacterium]|nr:MAG: hypothetical protein DRJ61_12590 [Acidobacteriota bacterium]
MGIITPACLPWYFLKVNNTKSRILIGIAPIVLMAAAHASPVWAADPFSFIVFGDLNGGDCQRNVRFHQLVTLMTAGDASFFVNTGDLIEGYGTTSCFGHDNSCAGTEASGNMAYQLAPLAGQTPPEDLAATFFPVIGNHDGGWGSGWYPDPCGDGICDLLDPSVYINHGSILDVPGFFAHNLDHGDICSVDQATSAHPTDFYYSFAFKNSYFIIIRQSEDYSGMLSCNGGHPGYDSCEAYCSDPALYLDSQRNNYCYSVFQWDWLVTELMAAVDDYDHIFVFGHAPMLGSGWNHSPTHGADQFRALFEEYDVDIFFNGHNHAYERTHPVRGSTVDPTGPVYITTGSAGALTDGINGDWFTAASYMQWTDYADLEDMTTYLEITVDGHEVSGRVFSLGAGEVDTFSLAKYGPLFADGFESGTTDAWFAGQRKAKRQKTP